MQSNEEKSRAVLKICKRKDANGIHFWSGNPGIDKSEDLVEMLWKINPHWRSPLCLKAGLDAPHLGVGIAAGEAASYEVYKDIMDIVIEGWHGYKPTDSHK